MQNKNITSHTTPDKLKFFTSFFNLSRGLKNSQKIVDEINLQGNIYTGVYKCLYTKGYYN